jgi:hypothetical protein
LVTYFRQLNESITFTPVQRSDVEQQSDYLATLDARRPTHGIGAEV